MRAEISNVQLNFFCPVKWDEMEVIDGASRYCSHCSKQVHDFTNAKAAEFARILAEGGGVCGRFRPEQMAVQPVKLYGWKKWVSAALVLVGINAFYNKAIAQKTPAQTNQTVQKKAPEEIRIDEPVGGAGPAYDKEAAYPGGIDQLNALVSRNLHFTKEMQEGRVFIFFSINVDGTTTDFKILRGISPANDAEALRVLKLMAKWKPALLSNKPVKAYYTVPVVFKKP